MKPTQFIAILLSTWMITSGAEASPALIFATCGYPSGTCVIDPTTNSVVTKYDGGGWAAAVSPDGVHLYTADDTVTINAVYVTDYINNSRVATIYTGGYDIRGMALTPDGGRLLVTHYQSSNLAVIDTKANTLIANPAVGRALSVAVSPDGTKAAIPQQGSTQWHILDLNTYDIMSFETDLDPHAVAWSPDGTKIFIGGYGNDISVFDATASDYPLIAKVSAGFSYDHSTSIWGLAISPDSQRLYITGYDGVGQLSYITVMDLTSPDYPIVSTIRPLNYFGYNITLTPDGGTLFVPSYANSTIDAYDTATNGLVSQIPLERSLGVGASLPPPQGVLFDQVSNAITTKDITVSSAAPSLQSLAVNRLPDNRVTISSAAPSLQSLAVNRLPNNRVSNNRVSKRSFILKSTFTLNNISSNGIKPALETLRILVGEFNVTVPSGCFKYKKATKTYRCSTKIQNISYVITIKPTTKINTFTLTATAKGASLPSTFSKPLPISFSIGNDAGRQVLN